MSRTFSDDELRLALMGYYDAVADASMPGSGRQFEYTPEHLARMEGLMHRHEKHQRRILTLQRVAVILLAFILTAATWLAVDVHARETFFNWVRTVYEDHVEYRFHGGPSAVPDELPVYELGWIPEGFELVEEDVTDIIYSAVYENQFNKDGLIISWMLSPDVSQISQYSESEELIINGFFCEYYEASIADDSNELVLIDDRRGAIIHINSTLSNEIIIKIAENINIQE